MINLCIPGFDACYSSPYPLFYPVGSLRSAVIYRLAIFMVYLPSTLAFTCPSTTERLLLAAMSGQDATMDGSPALIEGRAKG
jgi:hypothetical protein